jgi:multidrug transporter EmrE-like cation transporter
LAFLRLEPYKKAMTTHMTLSDLVGFVGVVLILISYLLLQISYFKPDSFFYSLWNIIGSFMILCSLYFNWNFSAVLMEVFWLLISVYGIFKARSKKRSTKTH